MLQKFDPPGVCARNLSECLAIQLRELNRYDPAMQALVRFLGETRFSQRAGEMSGYDTASSGRIRYVA